MEISDRTAAIVGFLLMFFTLGALIITSEPTVKSPSLWLASFVIMVGAGIGGAIIMFLYNRWLKKARTSLNTKEEKRWGVTNTVALEALKTQIRQTLGENLVAMFLTGSRVRGEEREGSDYDIAIIVSNVDEGAILGLREVFSDRRDFSVYLLDKNDLRTMPKAMFLQFVHSEKLYRDLDYPLPSKEEIEDYISSVRRDWLDRIRHYLILPHPHEKHASVLFPALKSVYLCLSYLAYKDTGNLPLTRKETVSLIEKQKSDSLGVSLMRILDNWDSYKEKYMQDPLPLLFQIETFFRTLQV